VQDMKIPVQVESRF